MIDRRKVKERLSRFYLDCAERLPNSDRGVLGLLQQIRRRQREQAAKAREAARLPTGSEFEYAAIRLLEVFPPEDFDKVVAGLQDLFPQDVYGQSLGRELKLAEGNLSSGGYSFIGTVTPRQIRLSPLRQRVLPTLPPEVESIGLSLHRILPSMLTVSLDARLGPMATERLRGILDQEHLPSMEFARWLPSVRSGRRFEPRGEQAQQRAVSKFLTGVRCGIERELGPYLTGYFSDSSYGGGPRLPAVEVIKLQGAPVEDGAFRAWLRQADGWLSCLGTRGPLAGSYAFKSANLVFCLKTNMPWAPQSEPYRVFFIDTADADPNRGQGRLESTLDGFLPAVVFLEFLDSAQKTTERLRKAAYGMVGQRPGGWLRRDFDLGQRLQRESMVLSRFEVELEQGGPLSMSWSALANFHRLEPTPPTSQEPLPDILLESVRHRTRFIKEHLALASGFFTNYLTLRNLDANLRLQRRILFWTVVVSLATLTALLTPHLDAVEHLILRVWSNTR